MADTRFTAAENLEDFQTSGVHERLEQFGRCFVVLHLNPPLNTFRMLNKILDQKQSPKNGKASPFGGDVRHTQWIIYKAREIEMWAKSAVCRQTRYRLNARRWSGHLQRSQAQSDLQARSSKSDEPAQFVVWRGPSPTGRNL